MKPVVLAVALLLATAAVVAQQPPSREERQRGDQTTRRPGDGRKAEWPPPSITEYKPRGASRARRARSWYYKNARKLVRGLPAKGFPD